MIYASITMYCLIGGLCIFIILYFMRNKSSRSNVVAPVPVIVENSKAPVHPIVTQSEPKKVRRNNVVKIVRPKPMNDAQKYLYSIKPNLTWWVELYGWGIFDKSVQELKGEQLFQNSNGIDLTVKKKINKDYLRAVNDWKNQQLVKRLYERGKCPVYKYESLWL